MTLEYFTNGDMECRVITLSDMHDEPSWDFDFEGLFEDEGDTIDS